MLSIDFQNFQIKRICSCVITKRCLSLISGPVLLHSTVGRSQLFFCLCSSIPNSRKFCFALFLSCRCSSSTPNVAFSTSHSFLNPVQLAMNSFFRSVLGVELGKAPAQPKLIFGQPAYLFANFIEDAMIARAATLSEAGIPGNNSLCRSLHNHVFTSSEEFGRAVIRSPAIYQQLSTLPYPQHLITADHVAEALAPGSPAASTPGTQVRCAL